VPENREGLFLFFLLDIVFLLWRADSVCCIEATVLAQTEPSADSCASAMTYDSVLDSDGHVGQRAEVLSGLSTRLRYTCAASGYVEGRTKLPHAQSGKLCQLSI